MQKKILVLENFGSKLSFALSGDMEKGMILLIPFCFQSILRKNCVDEILPIQK